MLHASDCVGASTTVSFVTVVNILISHERSHSTCCYCKATQKRKRLYCPFPLSASFASVNTAIDICTAQPAESNVCSESQTYEEQQSQHRIVESCAPVSALPVESSLAAVSTTAFELFKPNFVSLMIDFLRQQCVGQHKFESTHSSHTMPTLQVLDLTTAKTPACFHFHNKKVCSTTVQLSGGASDTLELNDIKNIGRGTQAFAISTTVSCSGGSTGVESAFKCDSKSVAVVFECFVHQVVTSFALACDTINVHVTDSYSSWCTTAASTAERNRPQLTPRISPMHFAATTVAGLQRLCCHGDAVREAENAGREHIIAARQLRQIQPQQR